MIHKLSDIHSNNIGEGTFIWQYCVVLERAVIGKNCNINCQVFIENDVVIGDNVTVKPGVQIWDGLRIENDVFIGPNVTFTNDLVPRSKNPPEAFLKTTVCKSASIGANSTIIGGVSIGKYSLIGAGSLVNKNIPPFTVWYGNPAKHHGFITKSKVIISLDMKDKHDNEYEIVNFEPIKV